MRRRFLTVLLFLSAIPAAAQEEEPPNRANLPPDERHNLDRALRDDPQKDLLERELAGKRKAGSAGEQADLRARLDRILREDTTREGSNEEVEELKRRLAEARRKRGEKKPPPENKPEEEPERKPPEEETSSGGSGIVWTILILVVAGVVALGLYAGITAWRQSRAGVRPEAKQQATTPPGAAPPVRREPEEWLGEARRLAAAGRWIEALRCLLFASLERLHRARLIDYERARTNRECVRDFRGADDGRARFRSLVGTFDAAIYGAMPFGAAEYQQAEAAARELGREVGDAGVA